VCRPHSLVLTGIYELLVISINSKFHYHTSFGFWVLVYPVGRIWTFIKCYCYLSVVSCLQGVLEYFREEKIY
jgi:hypothetical protein